MLQLSGAFKETGFQNPAGGHISGDFTADEGGNDHDPSGTAL